MLLFVAHGSRDPAWCESVHTLISQVQAKYGRDQVRLAYLQFTSPTVEEVVSDAIRSGVIHIRILPLFLARQGHVDRDLRPMIDELRQTSPEVDLELLPPMGDLPEFIDFLHRVAGHWQGA